jgi:drug/metabolite transporter (DMT)-like permease
MLFADTPSKRRIGIILGSLVTVCFSILETAGKWLSTHTPLIEIVWTRFAIAAVIAIMMMFYRGKMSDFLKEDFRIQFLRAIMMTSMTYLSFAGLKHLQLAQANSIQFSTPIIIALISSYFLKEKLTINKWIAIIGGFLGVLIILDPLGQHFHPAMFFILAQATIFALFNILTRKMASTSSPDMTIVYSTVLPTLFLAPFALDQWQKPTQHIDYLLFIVVGLFGFLGHYLLATAYRYAKPTTISPFFYQQIIYMVFLGWLVFDQVPNLNVLLGAMIVIACGLYLLFMENRQTKNERIE